LISLAGDNTFPRNNNNNNNNNNNPGTDQIAKFWLKQLTATHKHIAALFNKLIEEDQIPEWLTARVTFLFQKTRILKIQRITHL